MSFKTSVFIQPSTHGSTILGENHNICIVIYDFGSVLKTGNSPGTRIFENQQCPMDFIHSRVSVPGSGETVMPFRVPLTVRPASSSEEQIRCCSGCVPRTIEQLVRISGATETT